jgi:hypothetical protein
MSVLIPLFFCLRFNLHPSQHLCTHTLYMLHLAAPVRQESEIPLASSSQCFSSRLSWATILCLALHTISHQETRLEGLYKGGMLSLPSLPNCLSSRQLCAPLCLGPLFLHTLLHVLRHLSGMTAELRCLPLTLAIWILEAHIHHWILTWNCIQWHCEPCERLGIALSHPWTSVMP